MGRPAEGWTLRLRHGIWCVRFTAAGHQVERSTGKREHEREQAAALAPGIYAAEVRSPRRRPRAEVAPRSTGLLREVERWLSDEEPLRDEETSATYALYARAHWEPFFGSVSQLTTPRIEAYRSERLKRVAAETVRKELGALRAFLRWLGADEVIVPGVPRRATGKRVETHWTGSQEVSPAEVERVLSLLSGSARDRYTVAYETSLRPATLDQISNPQHWRPGARYLSIPDELDKARAGREVPLSDRAIEALGSAVRRKPKGKRAGPIFGTNRHRKLLKAAAKKALPGERGRKFVPTDIRAARVTHWLEQTGNLPGVQYLAGHRQATTTARYVRASLRAGEAVLGTVAPPKKGRIRNPG